MDSNSVKAITFKFLPLTKIKMKRLENIAKQFQDTYNFASVRLPSLQEIKQTKSRMAIEAIRKDVKSELHSQITQEAIESARANYSAIIETQGGNIPQLTANIIRVNNQAWKFKVKDNRVYITFPTDKIGKNKYLQMWLPIKTNEYLINLIKSTKFGVGQVNLKNQTFTTSYKVKTPKINYIPETKIGIDLGLNNLAVMVILGVDNIVLKAKFWGGNEVRHIRGMFHNYRREVQKIGRLDCNKKSKGYESNWMKNINHNISREIVDIAKQYPKPIIIMEDLHRFKRGKIQWNFYQIREMVRYKCELEGIKFKLINPNGTSQMCNKCGHVAKENRNGVLFKCQKCGYEVHADFNAGVNIAIIK